MFHDSNLNWFQSLLIPMFHQKLCCQLWWGVRNVCSWLFRNESLVQKTRVGLLKVHKYSNTNTQIYKNQKYRNACSFPLRLLFWNESMVQKTGVGLLKIQKYKQLKCLLLLTEIIVMKWVFVGEEGRTVGNRWNKSDAELISCCLLSSEKGACCWTGWKEKKLKIFWKSATTKTSKSLLKINVPILHRSKQSSLSSLIFKSKTIVYT